MTTFNDEIRALANNKADRLLDDLQQLRTEYFALHERLLTEQFSGRNSQSSAIERLSKLGMAYKALDEAYSAMNLARCI